MRETKCSIYTRRPYFWVGGNEHSATAAFQFMHGTSQVIYTDFFCPPAALTTCGSQIFFVLRNLSPNIYFTV